MTFEDYEKKHIDYVRKNSAECALFLKKNNVFPLDKPCKVCLIGEGGKYTQKGGTGSGDVNSRYYSTILSALRENGFEVTSEEWMDKVYKLQEEIYAKWLDGIIEEAKEVGISTWLYAMGKVPPTPSYDYNIDYACDVAIYVVKRVSGEGGDRSVKKGDIYLSDEEVRDIKYLNKKFSKFLLVLNTIGYVDLSPIIDEVDNILYLSQLGVETGNTFVDILLGKSNPSGKLATTWAKYEDYQTIGDFGNQDETRYKEGIYVGYKYFDTLKKDVMFPFGFGLSYSEFNYQVINVTNNKSNISIDVDVTNISNYKGKEVIQVYLSKPTNNFDQPYQHLVAFNKTSELENNKKETINLSFDLADFATYDEINARYILEKGEYIVRVGNSSRNTNVAAIINLDEDVVTLKTKNVGGKPDFKDFVPTYKQEKVSCKKIIKLNKTDFTYKEFNYNEVPHVNDYVKNLSDDDLLKLCIGRYNSKGTGSVIESFTTNNNTVPGACGETSIEIDSLNKTLVMADGTAGLRLLADYGINEDGYYFELKNDDGTVVGRYDKLLPQELLVAIKIAKEQRVAKVIKHQYATAIPIGTAIANSFNIEFATKLGDLVGDEMERFNVNLWLAPALNIHRSVLCGRNFEYYSEDPLVSGKMATSITNGVQTHKGCGTTIKHFCVNNQETNRFYNDSIVSERALREIYLKGFEIAVKESQPKAIMTSYNLLNNIHTAQRHDINYDVLRVEWGYKGMAMSDWGGTATEEDAFAKPKTATKAGCSFRRNIKGENDLMMPGSKQDFEDGKKALADGFLTREDLYICGTRIYEMIEELNK